MEASLNINRISFTQIQGWILCGYICISALAGYLSMIDYNGVFLIKCYLFVIFLFSIKYLVTSAKILDYIFLLFIVTMIISSVIKDYNVNLFNAGLFEIANMFFFLIGRSNLSNNNRIIQYGLPIYVIVSFIGLYLFFAMPSWYLNYKVDGWWMDYSENRILEMMRLSAFWQYPYWISYGGVIFFTFILSQTISKKKINRNELFLLIFIFIIVLLALQRVAIVWIILITLAYIIFYRRITIFFAILLIVIIGIVLMYSLQEDYVNRFFLKFEILSQNSFLKDRADAFSKFYNKEISYFGDGIGRYGHYAFAVLRQDAITDQGYLKILYETGLVGVFGFSFFIVYSIFNCFRELKTNLFDISIVVFFLIAMFGSNCIFVTGEHAIFFWFCLGRLSKTSLKQIPYKVSQK